MEVSVVSARRHTLAFAAATLLSAATVAGLAAIPASASTSGTLRPARVAAGVFYTYLNGTLNGEFTDPSDNLCINMAAPANAFDNDTDSYVTVYSGTGCAGPILTVGQFETTTLDQDYNSIEFTFESIDPPGN
jgi:hypothetical protein